MLQLNYSYVKEQFKLQLETIIAMILNGPTCIDYINEFELSKVRNGSTLNCRA